MSAVVVVTPAVLARRVCAALAVFSAVLHGAMVGQAQNVAAAALILVMTLICLFCARELWMRGSLRTWVVVGLMNLGMVAIHWSVPGCHPGAAVDGPAPSTLMVTATTVALLEAVIATGVLFYRTRDRASALALGRAELAQLAQTAR